MLHLPASKATFIAPLKPTLVTEPPAGDGWIHEIKHDGWRVQLVINGAEARVFTKNGHDWTGKFRSIAAAGEALPLSSAVIDGEAIVQDEQGRSDFRALRRALDHEPHRVIMFAFDLLALEGEDLRNRPLSERRQMLRELLGPNRPDAAIQFSDDVADGAALFAAADRLCLEGIVSKKASSKYRSGYQPSWLKTKCTTESEFTVIGAEREPGKPSFALLAKEEPDGLTYVGSAFITLDGPNRERFWSAMDRLSCDRPSLPMKKGQKAAWCRPQLRVRARHLRGEEMLRHASLTGIA